MSKVTTIQSAFNAGEFSSKLFGRVDVKQYQAGLGHCENYIPLIQGGITKRPGSDFIAEVKDSNAKTRMVPFVFSTVQAYIIEFGNQYLRFYMNDGQIQSGGSPVEIAGTPYVTADLFELKFVQNADVLWIFHPNYRPHTLTRSSHTSWTLEDLTFSTSAFRLKDGPYLDINADLTNNMTPSGTTSAITLTMTNNTFGLTDVGRLIRFRDSALNWTWLQITAYTDAKNVVALIRGPDLASTTASNVWRLGLYSDTTGYPAAGSFHENRLFMGGATENPFRVDATNTGDYQNFEPTAADGTVTDSHAFNFPLLASEVNSIRWMNSDERGLSIGTVGAEWLATASATAAAMTPTNIKIVRTGNRGSADIQSVKVEKATLFSQRSRKQMRELAYNFSIDGFQALDLNVFADTITGTGITELAYQQEPASIVWAVRDDGELLGFVYDAANQVVGWHHHNFNGIVESIASIPNNSNSFDELYMIVKRTINGVTKRYIEDMDNYWTFNSGVLLEDAIFVDSALTYSGTSTTVLTGLDHLEGETVSILGDGLVQTPKVVVSGQITLDTAVTKAQVGLKYTGVIETLRENFGANDGTSQNKTKRINRVAVRLDNSQNLKVGPDSSNMQKITNTSLISDDVESLWPRGYDKKGIIRIEHDDPLPSTITAIIAYLETYDR